jgi:hypothetical protein
MPKLTEYTNDFYQVVDAKGKIISQNKSKVIAIIDATKVRNNNFPWEVIHCIVVEVMNEKYPSDGRPR